MFHVRHSPLKARSFLNQLEWRNASISSGMQLAILVAESSLFVVGSTVAAFDRERPFLLAGMSLNPVTQLHVQS
jgi:hypothetical protein